MPGWNRWYHCIATTYGNWLPGDPRGFRTRGHREHVEGDYKSPPPEDMYAGRHNVARNRLKRPAVHLNNSARLLVLEEVLKSFEQHGIEGLAVSVSPTHMHLLARFPLKRKQPTLDERELRTSAVDDPVRHFIGQIKQWSSKRLIREGLLDGGAWGRRGKIVPITHREHQVNTYRYIVAHQQMNAAIWTKTAT